MQTTVLSSKDVKNLFTIATPIARKTIENQGCSMNLNAHEPEKGYMVGLKGTEMRVNVLEFNAGHIDLFIRKNLSLLFNRKCYIGTWINEDKVYIDISLNLRTKAVSLAYSKLNSQICIWDVEKKREIYCLNEQ